MDQTGFFHWLLKLMCGKAGSAIHVWQKLAVPHTCGFGDRFKRIRINDVGPGLHFCFASGVGLLQNL
jgi:hypothetical protein